MPNVAQKDFYRSLLMVTECVSVLMWHTTIHNITWDTKNSNREAYGSVVTDVRPVTQRLLVQASLWSPDVVCYTHRKGTWSTLSQSIRLILGTMHLHGSERNLTCFLKQISDYNLEAFLETLNIYIQNSGENKFINLKLKPFSVTNIKRCKISLAAFINKHTLKK